MKMKCFCYSIVLILFFCCTKNKNDNSYLLNFTLNNAYIINDSDTVSIQNGYFSDSIIDGIPPHSSNIFFIDGEIGDTLSSSCGNWSYVQNPNTTVEIWFPNNVISDGTYNYDKNNSVNDFFIQIRNNIVFDSTAYDYNFISSYEPLALTYSNSFTDYDSIGVDMAVLKVENSDTQSSEVRYHIETSNGNIIRGCYIGNLDKFKYIRSEGDCD
ncbi:MAG: hypothetical protein CL846_07785 [Crocinitomicaceae bacterium]|nr:hypothetical protein [Crocinitomicaceae bacterium]